MREPNGAPPASLDDVQLDDLCREPVMAKAGDPNDFMGSCVRLKHHRGRCQKITNGMTEAEALAITAQDLGDTPGAPSA